MKYPRWELGFEAGHIDIRHSCLSNLVVRDGGITAAVDNLGFVGNLAIVAYLDNHIVNYQDLAIGTL